MKYTIPMIAKAWGKSTEYIRAGLIIGAFPWGTAYKKPGAQRYSYDLYPAKVEEYFGKELFENNQ